MFNEGDTQQSLTYKPVALKFLIEWNLEMLVFEEGGKPEKPEKNPRSKDENQQQTQSTYDAGSRNRTRDTLVVGERTPAPPNHIQNWVFSNLVVVNFCTSVNQVQEVLC